MDGGKTRIWIRVPIEAVRAAVDALKERSGARHRLAAHLPLSREDDRAKADADDQHAEDLKTSIRGWERGEKPPGR